MGLFIRGGPERRSLNISHRLNLQKQKTLGNAAYSAAEFKAQFVMVARSMVTRNGSSPDGALN